MNKLGLISEQECMDAQTPKLVPHNVWGKEHTIAELELKEAQFMDIDTSCTDAITVIK